VINDVRYRCEVGHGSCKQDASGTLQANSLPALPQVHGSPAEQPGYAAAYGYGKTSEQYPSPYAQYPAQQYQVQAPAQALAQAPAQQYQQYQPQAVPTSRYQQYQHQAAIAQQYQPHAGAQLYQQQAVPALQYQPQAMPAGALDPCAYYTYSPPPGLSALPSAGLHLPGRAYTMSPQLLYGNSPPPYDSQMLAAQSPQFHVVAPQEVYSTAYMTSPPQVVYLPGGALLAPPLAAARAHQPQQQGQYATQSQYAYPCAVKPPSTTPTRNYAEMGLRAHSFSSDSTTVGYAASASMSPQQSTPQASYTNVYLALHAPQQHNGYASCMPHVVQVQPSVYYPPQQAAAAAAPGYGFPCGTFPPAFGNTRDSSREISPRSAAAHSESVFGAETPPQPAGEECDSEYSDIGESAPQTPRCASWLSNSCTEQLSSRLGVETGRSPPPPPPSPATRKQGVLRFPQVGDTASLAHPSVPSITPDSAQDAIQHTNSQQAGMCPTQTDYSGTGGMSVASEVN
jgi:hypothetical protein